MSKTPRCSLVKIVDKLSDDKSLSSIDWTLCCLYQIENSDTLVCPANSKNPDAGAGYVTLAANLQTFKEHGEISGYVKIQCLEEGAGIEAALVSNHAKFHKKCGNYFNTKNVQRLLKRKHTASPGEIDSESDVRVPKTRSTIDAKHVMKELRCILCDELSTEEELRHAATKGITQRVLECAKKLNDTKLLAKLSGPDMIALEAKYHPKCLVYLYNKVKSHDKRKNECTAARLNERMKSSVFAELISFINERKNNDAESPVFKLKDLTTLYSDRLRSLGITDFDLNATRFKEKLCQKVPTLEAHRKGNNVLLAFSSDIGEALADACRNDNDDNAMCLSKAAEIIRAELFESEQKFSGSFDVGCEERSVPSSLLALIHMILEGPSIKKQSEVSNKTKSLSIAQLIKYNSVKHSRQSSNVLTRHNQSQETPLPMYVGLMLYAETRKKSIINKMFDLGLSVSYDRVLNVTNGMGSSVCNFYSESKVVCPPNLNMGLFTLAAVDNIDHNPSSNTSKESFHGTAISLFQHCDVDKPNTPLQKISLQDGSKAAASRLPTWYTNVPPDASRTAEHPVLYYDKVIERDDLIHMRAIGEENNWLSDVASAIIIDDSANTKCNWSSFHAAKTSPPHPKCLSAILPLFPDPSHSVSMIKHSIDIVMKAVDFVNNGQTPVIACDQPLYAIAKQIQWTWPDKYGESKLVVMFGGLHIEIAVLKTLGHWLAGSGWCEALVHSGITTRGTADAFLQASHVKRSRYAHQVFVAALYVSQRAAYLDFLSTHTDQATSFEEFCTSRAKTCPQFQYWNLVLELELTLLILVRSIRQCNFALYVDTLETLLPWFFALDRTNYARWLSVHVEDLKNLPSLQSVVFKNFSDGKFTIQRSTKCFSAVAIDHAYEQNNKFLKGDGGVIGLTSNSISLNKWMLAGPELVRVVSEFEEGRGMQKISKTTHNEQSLASNQRFKRDVKALVSTLNDVGNPFKEDGSELISLLSKDIPDSSVQKTVREVKKVGEAMYADFVKDRLRGNNKSIIDVIKRNRLPLFKDHPSTNTNTKIKSLKSDTRLFSRLYISCQTRSGNMETFFSHENQQYPPSLSDSNGFLRHGTKSEIVSCLERGLDTTSTRPSVSAVIMDGAAVVQMLKPRACKTFLEYSTDVFMPYIYSFLSKCERLDLVWDEYCERSLKHQTRELRGKGIRRRVLPDVTIPANWQSFLRVNDNKRELFQLLSNMAIQDKENNIVATLGEDVICSQEQDCNYLKPCTQEEADSRMFLHCRDAVVKGFKTILVRTVDSDVVAIAVSQFHVIKADELWIAFGTGKNYRYIPIHELVSILGPQKSQCVGIFHAFTGCDTVSSFSGRGKRTAWDVWASYPEVTDAFLSLVHGATEISEEILLQLERFVVLLYDRTSSLQKVNDCRNVLFARKNRMLESIPPTRHALLQHSLRALYQAGHVWSQSTIASPLLPDPCHFGWLREGEVYSPLWTTLPTASDSCEELISCACKTLCKGKKCKCYRSSLPCTSLCACDGECLRDPEETIEQLVEEDTEIDNIIVDFYENDEFQCEYLRDTARELSESVEENQIVDNIIDEVFELDEMM